MNEAFEILKKYQNTISQEDYKILKRDLRILQTYRDHLKLESEYPEVLIKGQFYISGSYRSFHYFKDKEYYRLNPDERKKCEWMKKK